jgi:hypothetical protein
MSVRSTLKKDFKEAGRDVFDYMKLGLVAVGVNLPSAPLLFHQEYGTNIAFLYELQASIFALFVGGAVLQRTVGIIDNAVNQHSRQKRQAALQRIPKPS